MTTVSAAFRGLARMRRAAAVHPRGVAFGAQLTITETDAPLPAGTYDGVVRLSKGAGTPGARRDVLGVAFRVYVPGASEYWDFLFSSAGRGRLTRWLPVPVQRWGRTQYGTLGPYEKAGSWSWMMLTPDEATDAPAGIEIDTGETQWGFDVSVSGRRARWRKVGRLRMRTARIEVDGLTFDPVLNHPPGAVPAPAWLRELREAAYGGSRDGRGAARP